MQPDTPYKEDFYKKNQEGSRQSAKAIIPLVLELVKPKSVIDVGCGLGTWLSVLKELGVEEIFGVDGDYVDKKTLEIPEDRFGVFDLKNPLRMNRKFDLVLSLEVAEHLPSECAETFVESLVNLGPVILFSAAIPYQGGENHVNEQWPDYWVEYFQGKGYVVIDCIRKKIWNNRNIEWWYAQNTLMFARREYLESCPMLKREFEFTTAPQLSIVHPKQYLDSIRWMRQLSLAAKDIAALIPPRHVFILVDQDQFEGLITGGRHIPFLERDGVYWGPPPDNETAIRELERLRESGANLIVFGWPAFWWLDHYVEMHHYLRSKYKCVLKNDRLVIFDLRR